MGESGVTQSGWSELDLAKFEQQPVKFRVADDGRIQNMIAVIVEMDLLLKFRVTLLEVPIVHISHL